MAKKVIDPAKTYNVDDFIQMKYSDNATYYNFSMLEKYDGVEHTVFNIADDYLENMEVVKLKFSSEELARYKYHPDLLAYDIYGSTQLDFIIMALNDIIDPKDFTKSTIYLPYSSTLETFLDKVYSANYTMIQNNRLQNDISL